MAQMQIFGSKMQFFGPKSIFFRNHPFFFDTIMTGHQKDNFFVLTLMHGGPRGSRGGPFWAKKGQNPARKPENNPPSDQTATYRETEVIQSYLRTWGTYDPIESGPSDLKKWGLYSRSVKKCRFWGQKWAPAAAPRPSVHQGQHKKVVFLLSSHHSTNTFWLCPKKSKFFPQKCIFGSERGYFGII